MTIQTEHSVEQGPAASVGDDFPQVADPFRRELLAHCYRMTGSVHDAEDLVQETYLRAWRAYHSFEGRSSVRTWLYRIATNVCLDELRHRKLLKWQPWETFVSLFHPSQVARDNPERDALQTETKHEVEIVLEKLSERYRIALVLREYHGLGYEDIADIMGTTRTAVKTLLLRARESFRLHYAKLHPLLAEQARGPRVLPRAMGRQPAHALAAALA